MANLAEKKYINKYLNSVEKLRRLDILNKMKSHDNYLPISLVDDLLCLDMSILEKKALLEIVDSSNNLYLEDFLTRNLQQWPQDLSTLALRHWAEKTQKLLWFRILPLATSPHISQRVRYTMLDLTWHTGGWHLLERMLKSEGLEDLSPAFHALLLQRCLEWSIHDEKIMNLARKTFRALEHPYPDDKALPSAIAYMARFDMNGLYELVSQVTNNEIWRDFIRILQTAERQFSVTESHLKNIIESEYLEADFVEFWPPVWLRHKLDAKIITGTLRKMFDRGMEKGPAITVHFTGCSPEMLIDSICELEDNRHFGRALESLGGLITNPIPQKIFDELRIRIQAADDPVGLIAALPPKIRLELSALGEQSRDEQKRSPFFSVLKEEEEAISSLDYKPNQYIYSPWSSDKPLSVDETIEISDVNRRKFFNLAYRNITFLEKLPSAKNDYWLNLILAWTSSGEEALASLAALARRAPAVYRICYINTLEKFRGIDAAALKLLDFVRSNEEDELRAVIKALGGIGTPRALQELISTLTRPNIRIQLALDICNILKSNDLRSLQSELRSAINDLNIASNGEEKSSELKEALSELLFIEATDIVTRAKEDETTQSNISVVANSAIDLDLDKILAGKLPYYNVLSSEVKRALRTAQFFHTQVMIGAKHQKNIDLSPVIDMQYKALELIFRENFEDPCTKIIQRGILQRKLDIIGYARPIPSAMDEFEAHIKSLPVVNSIPFFSKFKLRKLLRSICQFRPGKRFTLDGLKAFGLFFLVFSRKNCRYGLQNQFVLPFATDEELAEFCRTLHIFQDFRNRAAHEGFHPEASNDMDAIWRNTAEIIQNTYKIKEFLDGSAEKGYSTPENKSEPIIQRKVS